MGRDAADKPTWKDVDVVGIATCPTDDSTEAALFVPLDDTSGAGLYGFIPSSPASELTRRLRSALDKATIGVQVTDVSTLSDYERARLQPFRLLFACAAALGGVALGMSLIGLVGTVNYLVRTRARDIAIRMALGCSRQTAVAQVLTRVVVALIVGLLFGCLAGWAGARTLTTIAGVGGDVWSESALLLAGALFLVALGAAAGQLATGSA